MFVKKVGASVSSGETTDLANQKILELGVSLQSGKAKPSATPDPLHSSGETWFWKCCVAWRQTQSRHIKKSATLASSVEDAAAEAAENLDTWRLISELADIT